MLKVRALTAGATADDVRAGAAIFHLDRRGTPLAESWLPVPAVLKPPGPADVTAGRARVYSRSGETAATAEQPQRVIEWVVPRVLVL